ncbi:MAG: tetratricopeptide repeat protein [Planctomycetota bacterium]|nr:tetratricopeptide repeat protein [Planctomycetota bacterium]
MRKERVLLLIGLVMLIGVALLSRPSARSGDDWTPPSSSRSKHTGCVQTRSKFVADEASMYVSARTQSPFMLPSEKVDLPPEDISFPPVSRVLPALPVPSPFPPFATAGEWRFVLGPPCAADAQTGLPAEADLDSLIASTETTTGPSQPGSESGGPCDILHLKDGEKVEGRIDAQTKEGTWILRKKDGIRAYYATKDIARVERARSSTQEYQERAAKADKGGAVAHVELAAWCEKEGLLPEAALELEKALSGSPRDIQVALQLGGIYRTMVDLDRELDVYVRTAKNSPTSIERVLLKLGEVYELLGLAGKARDAYVAATEALPTFTPARVALALLVVSNGMESDLPRAEEELDRVASEGGDGVKSPGYTLARGLLLFLKGNSTDTKKTLTEAAAMKENTLAASNALTVCALLDGDLPSAAKFAMDAVKSSPFAPAPWNNLGFLYLVSGQHSLAAKAFACAFKWSPASAEAKAGLALCEFAAQKPDEALAAAVEAVTINPKSLSARLALGCISIEKGDLDGAEDNLKAALEIGPSFTEPPLALGLLAMSRYGFQDAVAFLERIAPRYQKRLECKYALGVAYLGQNQLDRADREFREILKLDDKSVGAINGLAYLAFVNRRTAEAVKRFNDVIRTEPANEYAVSSLKKIGESVTRTLWEDTFHRSDRDDIGRGWEEQEGRFGVSIQLARKRVLFTGTQAVKDWGITSLERTVRESTFLTIEAELDVSRCTGAVAGVVVATQTQAGKQRGGLLLGLDEDRMPAYCTAASFDDVLDWKKLGTQAVSSDTVSLSIDRPPRAPGSRGQAEFRLLVNGQELGRVPESKVTGSEQLIAGVFGTAQKDLKWELEVARVKIIEKK